MMPLLQRVRYRWRDLQSDEKSFRTVPAEQGSFLRNLGVIRNDVVSTLHWPANKAIPANKEVLFSGTFKGRPY